MSDILNEYERRIHDYAQIQLEPYLARLGRHKKSAFRNHGKEINDSLWGTLGVRDFEVVFLDSPLMQRLRRIHQLGTADYIYPSATHTRLAHSLGVLNRASLMIDSLNAAAEDKGLKSPIDSDTAQLLRVAALLHDIGHTALSHSIENALKYIKQVRTIVSDFQTYKGEDFDIEVSVSLTEINSYFILTSPAMAELFNHAERLTARAIGDSDSIDKISKAIIGVPISDQPPYLHSIINGPFDADKLDYLPRDALRAGVPNITDSNRLLRKLRVVQTHSRRLPRILRDKVEQDSLVTITGVARSGNRALDEVILGRTLLFDKVYRHHGTREAEALVAEIFTYLDASEKDSLAPLLFALGAVDGEIIGLDEWVLRRYKLNYRNVHAKAAVAAANRLLARDLPVRCASFGRKMPEDPYELEPDHTLGLSTLLDDLDHQQNRRDLARRIAERIESALDKSSEVVPPDLANQIWIDPPSASDDVGVDDTMLVGNSERIVPFDEEAPETVMWAGAYSQTRDSGYVFGPEEFAPAIALGTEAVLRTEYGIRLPEIALCYSQVTRALLDEWRVKLSTGGMYEHCPRDLLPVPQILRSQETADRIRNVCDRFNGYQGPNSERSKLGHQGLTDKRISDFLSQFESKSMIDAALRAIEHFKVVGRGQVVNTIKKFISVNPNFENAVVVPFGSQRDSSSPAAYFALDAQERFSNLLVDDLAGAIDRNRPILIIDDIIHSGQQADGIVSGWFGDPKPAKKLNEERRPLSPKLQDALREKQDQVAFLFVVGAKEGKEHLEESLKRFNMEKAVVKIEDSDLPSIEDDIFSTANQQREFQIACQAIGKQLLAGDQKWSDRLLGYGNHGLLLAHVYNTPAQTLTAFWKAGTVNGRPWEPLLPRRIKF